jgi:hypothetical protein
MLKENLDKRICDIEEGAVNTETYREYLIFGIGYFEIAWENLDDMDDEELTNLLNFIDDLWDK